MILLIMKKELLKMKKNEKNPSIHNIEFKKCFFEEANVVVTTLQQIKNLLLRNVY
jgi:hypothetical protein